MCQEVRERSDLPVVLEDEGFRATPTEATRLKEIESLLIVEEGSSLSVCSKDTQSTTLTAKVGSKMGSINWRILSCLVLLKQGRAIGESCQPVTKLLPQTDVISRLRGHYDQSVDKLGEGVLSNLKEKQAEHEKIVMIDEMLSQLTNDDPEVRRADSTL